MAQKYIHYLMLFCVAFVLTQCEEIDNTPSAPTDFQISDPELRVPLNESSMNVAVKGPRAGRPVLNTTGSRPQR